MSFAYPLSFEFFTGEASSDDQRWDVAIAGHGYMIDTKYLADFGRQTVPMIRQQADTSNKPGEQSLNPSGLWRRSMESWHHGAGQDWYDRPDSDPYRFRSSKGVNPWNKYGLSLLPGTTQVESSTDTNVYLAVAAGRLYMSEGQTVRVTGVGDTTFATATGAPAAAVSGLASDGTTLYAGFTASGVYSTTGTALASLYTGTASLVRYVRGRLIVASGKAVYNPTGAAGTAITAGTLLLDHPNSGWTWTDAAESHQSIYLSGYAGDKSIIYRSTIKADGTGLDVAIPAAELPDGELARSMQGYLGYVVIGTDKGVRFAVADAEGNLTLGSLIPTGSPVLCAEGQDRFVWYGLTNYDATSTGLGRLDLQNFVADLTPAYASDLMVTGQGSVTSVVTYLGKRVLAVSGLGAYQETAATVASGTLVSGRVTFGIPDVKTAVDVTIRHDPLPASAAVTLAVALDDAAPVTAGTSELDGASVSPPDAFVINPNRASHFELTATLAGATTLRRVTLTADPTADRTDMLQVPLLLWDTVELPGGVPAAVDVQAEKEFLMDLLRSRIVVNYQEDGDTYQVVLDDRTWRPEQRSRGGHWQGTFVARLKEM